MKKFNLFLVLLLLFNLTVFAQNNEEQTKDKPIKHGLGAMVGYSAGSGPAYRHYFNKLSVIGAITPVINLETKESYVNTGLTFTYDCYSARKVDLFVYQSTKYVYFKDRFHSYDPVYNENVEHSKINEYVNVGLGFGVDFKASRHFYITGMLGYGALENFKKIQYIGELGMFYCF